ncbi:MAG: hypothetical protein OES20_01535 [Gammaproteobacteria bacterium]|nr:hypothetical protein [Gammaproteobacteria bacterium]
MSGLAHFLEDEGLSTVVIALVREHVVKMSPPRALWVPFEMGRPFATPNDIEQQRRVLKAALTLLDEPGPEPILKDYAEETSHLEGDLNWVPPSKLNAKSVIAEAHSILPIWHKAQTRLGRTSVGISGLSPEAAVEYIDRYLSPDPMPNPKGMAPVSRARFAIDDIKVFYFEAALASGGHPASHQLNEWFWNQTLAGKMILDFQESARLSNDKNLRSIADYLAPPERTYEYLNSA